jgi:starch synthase (maltosyl-transferring)
MKPCPHAVIQDVRPALEGGLSPLKRTVGEVIPVEATVFRDGHDVLRAAVKWRRSQDREWREVPMTCVNRGLDLWTAEFRLEENARYRYTVEAWTDPYATWLADFRKRVKAGQANLRSERLEGTALVEAVLPRVTGDGRRELEEVLARFGQADLSGAGALAAAEGAEALMARAQPRADAVVRDPEIEIMADRPRALFGSWYEIFVRSQGTVPGRPATFREAERRFPDIREMGFDVLYLAPIHPIGKTNRKGRNNSLQAAPGDPGSPWAVGSAAGGHDAVEPALGTMADFDHFVAEARRHGMEIAIDFAIQVSPDHPWVKAHPDWFYRRPDGTIKYAENPPKKYEDVYPLNFDSPDREALWAEMKRVVLFWAGRGVRIFRVDNPHTKPPVFWKWLIDGVQEEYPDVLFLAEAFTRPPMMKHLAKIGYSQSYTYFTWRHTKEELTEYLSELADPARADFFRPNLFVNTPDILPKILVDGGKPAFRMRLALAATLSPSYGIYSGFELCEADWIAHHAIPDDVEYKDSEKYEIKVRDWFAPGNIRDFVARINRIRRENPAFQELANLRFLPADNDQILFYRKASRDGSNVLLVAVNLDPHHPQETMVTVPPDASGTAPGGKYEVRDLLTDAVYEWSDRNYVRLDPQVQPAHILRIERRP